MKRSLIILCALVAACGGDDDIAVTPTWSGEIHLILRANCVRCHDDPARQGAPRYFRLDRYGRTENESTGRFADGAGDMADLIVERAALLEDMPPDGPPLTDTQRDLLVRWLFAGAPE